MTGIVSNFIKALSSCWNASMVNDKDELKLTSSTGLVTTTADAATQDEWVTGIPEDIPDKDRWIWQSVIHKTWYERGVWAWTLDFEAYGNGIGELDPATRKHLRERVTALMDQVTELNTFAARRAFFSVKKIDDEMTAKEMEENERAISKLKEEFRLSPHMGAGESEPTAADSTTADSTHLPMRDRTACMAHPAESLPMPMGDEPSKKPLIVRIAEIPARMHELEEPDKACAELMTQNRNWPTSGIDGSRNIAMRHFDAMMRVLIHGMVDMKTSRLVALKTERMYQILSDAEKHYVASVNKYDVVLTKPWDLYMLLIDQVAAPLGRVEGHFSDIVSGKAVDIKQYLINPERKVDQDELEGTTKYWNRHLGLLPAFEHVIPLDFDTDDFSAVAAVQHEFRQLVAMAARERKPVLAMLNVGNDALGLVATIRDGKPAYYICDTNGPSDETWTQSIESSYIKKLAFFSNGSINATNTTYCGYSMQEDTPNASGPLTCWMLEELAWRHKAAPAVSIKVLFDNCHATWLNDIAYQSRKKEFVRLLLARMLARMGA